jgi:hypothetical protein
VNKILITLMVGTGGLYLFFCFLVACIAGIDGKLEKNIKFRFFWGVSLYIGRFTIISFVLSAFFGMIYYLS